MNAKAQQSLANLGRALGRLREALDHPATDPLVADATIQRFEFAFELSWKTFGHLFAFEGIEAKTPREALREAYRVGWIEDETAWLEMLRDRNLTSHVYDEDVATAIYHRIRRNAPALLRAHARLVERYAAHE